MKKSSFTRLFMITMASVAIACSSTTIVSNKPLPPGQEKKLTGSQSAKSYAPDQANKKTGTPSTGQTKKKK